MILTKTTVTSIFTCAEVETRHFVVGVERTVEILVPGRVNRFNRFKCIELDPKLRGAADNNIGSLHSLQRSMIDADYFGQYCTQ